MFGLTARGIVLLVTGIVVSTPLARAGEPTRSEREAMYYRYLEFPSYVKGGSIEPGKLADIVLLDANPLKDIKNTQTIWRVIKGGWLFDPEKLRPPESVTAGK